MKFQMIFLLTERNVLIICRTFFSGKCCLFVVFDHCLISLKAFHVLRYPLNENHVLTNNTQIIYMISIKAIKINSKSSNLFGKNFKPH